MDFFTLFPDLEPWVQNLAKVWPASVIKPSIWMFAAIEAVHLLALGLMGGCVILLNMRLIGVGLTTEPAAAVERNLRPWLWTGVAVVLLTGVAIGMSNAEKLYTSPSFFVKMISLAAGLIFSFGVTNAVARSEGAVSMTARILAVVAGLLWLASLGVFGTSLGSNPGTVHIIAAGLLIAVAFSTNRTRIALASAVGLIGVAYILNTYVIHDIWDPEGMDLATIDTVNVWLMRITGLAVVAAMAFEIFIARSIRETSPTAKIIGLFSILTWVTVAAAGRWIGLS